MTAKFEIREAKASDAKNLNAYIREIYRTSSHLITRGDEFRTGSFKQRFWITKKAVHPYETCLIAINGNEIIGMLDSWTDGRKRVRHNTSFAMSVKESMRNQGIGKSLLQAFILWVKAHNTLERIELHVHSDNVAAQQLYENLGFQLEGTRRKVLKYEDGRVIDDHIMALWP